MLGTRILSFCLFTSLLGAGCGSSSAPIVASSFQPPPASQTETVSLKVRHSAPVGANRVILFGFDPQGELVSRTQLEQFTPERTLQVPSSLQVLRARYHDASGRVAFASLNFPRGVSSGEVAHLSAGREIDDWDRHIGPNPYLVVAPVGAQWFRTTRNERRNIDLSAVYTQDEPSSILRIRKTGSGAIFEAIGPGVGRWSCFFLSGPRLELDGADHIYAPSDLDSLNLGIVHRMAPIDALNFDLFGETSKQLAVFEHAHYAFFGPVTWSVDDPRVAQVRTDFALNQTPVAYVTAVARGTTTVRAAIGSRSFNLPVNVSVGNVRSLRAQPNRVLLKQTESQTLQVFATSNAGSEVNVSAGVTWSSSNPAVASVAANGSVTGHQSGFCSITGTFYEFGQVVVDVAVEP